VGDTIPIHYNNKVYQIDIIDAKPAEAISVIETDCNVDFAPPLDYVEETTVPMSGVSAAGATSSSVSQQSLGGSAKQEAVEEPPQPRFSAFTGSAKRLDGKPASEAPPLPAQGPSSTTDNAVSGAPPSNGLGRKKSGKLMFKDRLAAKFSSPDAQTSSASQAKKPSSDTDGVDAAEKKKDAEDGFKPFQGKSYRLA
jgi:ubiquitin fusion degradation protein 1